MIVYMVMRGVPYEGTCVMSLHSTYEFADARRKEYEKDEEGDYCYFSIEEKELED